MQNYVYTKTFNIKVYSYAGVFKKTLTASDNIYNISFSNSTGFGNNTITIQGARYDEASALKQKDIVHVYVNVDRVIDGQNVRTVDNKLIFKGEIRSIVTAFDQGKSTVTIGAIGITTALTNIIYGSGTYLKDPADHIRDIIAYFNTQFGYSYFSYDSTTIVDFGVDSEVTFENDTCFSAIQKVVKNTTYMFFVSNDGMVYFRPAGYKTHHLGFLREATKLIVDEQSDKLVNDLTLEYEGGSIEGYDNPASIAEYGRRQAYVADSSIENLSTANQRAAAYFDQFANPLVKVQIDVNSNYDIENIEIGDYVTLSNPFYTIVEKTVQKVEYRTDYAVVYLNSYDSLESALSEI